MGTDFAPFPLAVTYEDEDAATFEIKHPALDLKVPIWGNECFWTDPPPDHCFKIPPIKPVRTFGPEICNPLGSVSALSTALSPAKSGSDVGYVTPDTDLDDFPPHLIPLIRILQEAAVK